MTPLTDDELGVLLRESFAEHEDMASPERARFLAPYAVRARPAVTRRRVMVCATAVAALALGTAVAVQLSRPHLPSAGRSTSPVSSPSGPQRQLVDADMERLTREHLAGVLMAAPMPTGLTQVSHAPVAALAQQYTGIGSRTALRATAFWSGSGSPAEVAAWLVAHQAPGWARGGYGQASDGQTELLTADYDHADASTEHGPTTLAYVIAPFEGGVAVRVDALGAWRPVRVPALRIDPTAVTGAELVLTRPSTTPPTSSQMVNTVRSGHLSTAQVRPVIANLNEQRAAIPLGAISCPAMWGVTRDLLLLHTTSGDVGVRVVFACGGDITIQRDGHDVAPGLEGNDTIDKLLTSLSAGIPMATSTSTGG